jgi:acyl-coenzyme A thioesterase PaaI-like protein
VSVCSQSASPLDDALGLALEEARDGTASLLFEPGPLAVVDGDGPAFLHGGALATCVDTASWHAAESASPGPWVVASLQLDALRLARPEPHRVTARCVKAGRLLAVVDVEIASKGEPGRVVAVGRATLARTA